ncbi:MAG: hypothetical protein LBS90_00745 [Oscillospiraceae bacterium]|jgi:cytoskeletal protein RodZ|nr:hypothetical protein [Oscillospiraceae bacterium]
MKKTLRILLALSLVLALAAAVACKKDDAETSPTPDDSITSPTPDDSSTSPTPDDSSTSPAPDETNPGGDVATPPELTAEYTYGGAWPLAAGTYYPELDNAGIPAGAQVYSAYLMAEDYSATPLPVPPSLTGYTQVGTLAELVPGTWAVVDVVGYPYIFTLD